MHVRQIKCSMIVASCSLFFCRRGWFFCVFGCLFAYGEGVTTRVGIRGEDLLRDHRISFEAPEIEVLGEFIIKSGCRQRSCLQGSHELG